MFKTNSFEFDQFRCKQPLVWRRPPTRANTVSWFAHSSTRCSLFADIQRPIPVPSLRNGILVIILCLGARESLAGRMRAPRAEERSEASRRLCMRCWAA